jgi:hypothetical protein
MDFQPLNPMTSTNSTWNVDHLLAHHSQSLLLPDGRQEFFSQIIEEECEILGEPTVEDDGSHKGYANEWYFKAPSGNTVAIGFRWGTPRLRGDGRTTVEDVIEFVDYLQSRLTET